MKKKVTIICLIILLIIGIVGGLYGTKIITTISASTTSSEAPSDITDGTSANTSDYDYNHLDLRVDTSYTIGSVEYTAEDVSITIVKSSGDDILLISDEATTDENSSEDIEEYKSEVGHAQGESLELMQGDYIYITLSFTYYNGSKNVTATVQLEYELTEEDNECEGGSLGQENYGYDITIKVADYVEIVENEEVATYDYTINYYYNGVQDTSATIEGAATEGTEITYTDKIKDGYELDEEATVETSMTISSTEENVLNIYYVSEEEEETTYSYTINYYYDGVQDESETITGTATEGTEITYTDKIKDGYELDEEATVETSMTISSTGENVLNIYYVSEEEEEETTEEEIITYTITVKYIDKDTGEELTDTITITGVTGDTYSTEQKEFDGYTFVSVTGETDGTIEDEDLTIIYYYEAEEETIISSIVSTGDSLPVIACEVILIVILANAIQVVYKKIKNN